MRTATILWGGLLATGCYAAGAQEVGELRLGRKTERLYAEAGLDQDGVLVVRADHPRIGPDTVLERGGDAVLPARAGADG